MNVIENFKHQVAKFFNAPYAVAVDSSTQHKTLPTLSKSVK